MSFNTLPYLVFLPLAALAWLAAPRPARIWVLLAANGVFYAFGGTPGLAVFLVLAALLAWAGGLGIQRGRHPRAWLAGTLLACVALLCFFKYNRFFPALADSLAALGMPVSAGGWLLMPLGISYYTFTAVSYLVDVYRKKIPAEGNFLYLLAFTSLFATVTAGPICRAGDILPQLHAPARFEEGRVVNGLQVMLVGYFKKIAVADMLFKFVDTVYGNLPAYSGLTLTLAALGYGVYLYADFSGYSDIARGSALILGLRLPENFRVPYCAAGLGEFWDRWHISLSSWLKDYIYIPLGGSRKGAVRRVLNMLAVFVVSGLWHGVGLSFLFWGLLHGVGRVFEVLTGLGRRRTTGPVRWLHVALTFVYVNVCWVFFRCENLADAFYVLTAQFAGGDVIAQCRAAVAAGFDATPLLMLGYGAFCILAVALLTTWDAWRVRGLAGGGAEIAFARLGTARRWVLYYLFLAFIFAAFLMQNGYLVGSASFAYGGF